MSDSPQPGGAGPHSHPHHIPAAAAHGADSRRRLAQLMREAVAFSSQHVHQGGIPFTALVVDKDGAVVGRGVNRVREFHDPLAHAEVEAVRDACRTMGSHSLPGMTLLASGEPCALCYLSALYAGISQVLYAVDRDDAAAYGFDYRGTYSLYKSDPRDWRGLAVGHLPVPERLQPFLAFRSRLREP
ncbi:MAG: nucleoside deaminase [Burkholderiaceae bacterium]|nr:nucleoside deaminase [Burkholderiaceae bacterium]